MAFTCTVSRAGPRFATTGAAVKPDAVDGLRDLVLLTGARHLGRGRIELQPPLPALLLRLGNGRDEGRLAAARHQRHGAANAYLPEFAADHNRRFAVAPREAEDAHRPVPHDADELALILSEHHVRKLSRNLTFRSSGASTS